MSDAKYRELAVKWTNIATGLEQDNVDRRGVLDERAKRVEERVLGAGDRGGDTRFKKLLKEEISKVAQDLTEEKQQTLKIVSQKDKQINQMQTTLKVLQQSEQHSRQMNEKQLVNNIDQKILSISTSISKVSRESSAGVEEKRLLVRNQLGFMRQQLENERRAREENLRLLTDQIEQELGDFQDQLNIEKRMRQESQVKLFSMIQQIGQELKDLLASQTRQRQTTNECLLKLLQDTCSKIFQNF